MCYLERRGVRELLARTLPDWRTAPNQNPVVTVALASFATALTGGWRFAHVERPRSDDIVRAIFGVRGEAPPLRR
jgi:hypothetical protein